MQLDRLGWHDRLRQELESLNDERLRPARVTRTDAIGCRLLTEEGEAAGRLSGRLRAAARDGAPLAVGDWVAAVPDAGRGSGSGSGSAHPADRLAEPEPQPEPLSYVVHAVLSRSSALHRRAAGGASAEQVIAANVDVAFIVAALDQPLNPRRLERYLAVALGGGVAPVLVLNKADAADDVAAAEREAAAVAGAAPVHAVSAATGAGVDALRAHAGPGRTVCLLGPSGAGKSTLANRLLGADVLATGGVREADRKGRHTTTWRELVVAPDGTVLIDTPGMRELGLAGGDDGVRGAFADVEALAALCRFRDCAHATEPGCAVRAAVESGDLPAERVEARAKLLREAAIAARKRSEHGRRDARAEARSWGKIGRNAGHAKRARREEW